MKFENRVQEAKHKILRELARHTWQEKDVFSAFNSISDEVIVKGAPPISCCIYKDRAIIADRMRVGLGDKIGQQGLIQVVTIACDECPKSGHTVTDLCRGCMAHNCQEACPKNAIVIDNNGYAHIGKNLCVECGACARACKYQAIVNFRRPCQNACERNAVTMNEDGDAQIIYDKCVGCGACVKECPFGALLDRSRIVDAVEMIRDRKKNGYRVYAAVAPAVAGQFKGMRMEQVIEGIRKLGFDGVYEVSEGADVTAKKEAEELLEKGFLTTSCCPSFVEYIKMEFPELEKHVSSTLSPMAYTGQIIKEKDPDAKVIFIGPCIAKKHEGKQERVAPYIDWVLTFEELAAMFESIELDYDSLEGSAFDNTGSSFGRAYPVSGGVAASVKQALKEMGHEDFEVKPVICSGYSECRKALLKAKMGKLDGNIIEGMFCEGGCINGKGCLTRKGNPAYNVNQYCDSSEKKEIIG